MAIDVAKLRLILVTDRFLARGRSIVDIALAAARGGATKFSFARSRRLLASFWKSPAN